MQTKKRIIARLDVKPPDVIKPIHYEGLRKVGSPEELALRYYEQGADEIFYLDAVASLYRRPIVYEAILETAKNVFVPFCVGGGIQTVNDIVKLLNHGADKITINTFAIENPQLIREASRIFGSQCITVSIQAKKWDGWWECYTDCGRIRTGKNVLDWAKEVEDLGAGEILVTSVDRDGRRDGFDYELIQNLTEKTTIPVIAGGGAGSLPDIAKVLFESQADGVVIASLLHYGIHTISEIKQYLSEETFQEVS